VSERAGRGGAVDLKVPANRAHLAARTIVSASSSASVDVRRGDKPISEVIAMKESGRGDVEEAAVGDVEQGTATSTGEDDNDTVVSETVDDDNDVPDTRKSGVWFVEGGLETGAGGIGNEDLGK
jgi:hypothetical protein